MPKAKGYPRKRWSRQAHHSACPLRGHLDLYPLESGRSRRSINAVRGCKAAYTLPFYLSPFQ